MGDIKTFSTRIAEYIIAEAVSSNEMEAQLLQVEVGAALVMLDSVSYLSDGTPIEYFHALHRGDRSRFKVELNRIRKRGDSKGLLNDGKRNLPPSN